MPKGSGLTEGCHVDLNEQPNVSWFFTGERRVGGLVFHTEDCWMGGGFLVMPSGFNNPFFEKMCASFPDFGGPKLELSPFYDESFSLVLLQVP